MAEPTQNRRVDASLPAGTEAGGCFPFLAPENGGRRAEILRLALAGAVVTLVATGLTLALAQGSRDDAPTVEAESAIPVDLPAAEAAPAPASAADDGPPQQALQPTATQQAPAPVPPREHEEPTPAPPAETPDVPPPPPIPDAPAELERKPTETPPPPPPVAAAPPSPAQEEHAPDGARETVVDAANANDEEAKPHASRHAITAWQRSLMRSIEAAKKRVRHPPHLAATVDVAFSIDATGALKSEAVTSSSGSPVLDQAALALVREAAPFEPPPRGANAKDSSFVVPVRFR